MISHKSYYKNIFLKTCKLSSTLNEKSRTKSLRGFCHERLPVLGMKFLMALREVSPLMMTSRSEATLTMLESFNNGLKSFSSSTKL